MRQVLPALLLGSLACACGSSQGDGEEIVLRGDVIAKQIETSLKGTRGQIHCDSVGKSGERKPGCFLQLSPALGDRRFEFSVPDRTVDMGIAGQVVYRAHYIRLGSISVTTTPGRFVLTAGFTSGDVALKGTHTTLGDAAVPDIRLENMRLTVKLQPVVNPKSQITYDKPEVEFRANVDNTFIPRFSVLGRTIDVMDTLTNYRRDLCQAIEKQIQLALDDPSRKTALAQKIEEGISGQITGPTSPVVGLRFAGTDLVVKLRGR